MFRTIRLHVDFDLCRACRSCIASKACRLKAIVQVDSGEPPYLEISRCLDCRVCVPACPFGAIRQISDEL
jgi:Fe-S-cluster-containing hydrogenase component 2